MIINGTYDEKTGTFTFEYEVPVDGPGGAFGGVGVKTKAFTVTLTAEELKRIPNATITTADNISTASIDTKQLDKFYKTKVKEVGDEPKPSTVAAAVWDPNATYQADEAVEEPAYKKGMPITKEMLLGKKGIAKDPVTGAITFILPANEEAETLAGKGGTLNPSFAVILPQKSYIPKKYYDSGSSATAVAYDAITAQENLVYELTRTNRIDEFKKLLLDKGFYEFAGMQLPQVRSSMAQKGVADSFMLSALNGFLYTYSQQNYQNILEDSETFSYDEFINNYKPSFVEEAAYIPSRRDADAAVDAAYIEYVGRRATDKEKQAFFAALEREALSDPVRNVPGMGAGPDTRLGGFTEADLGDFASEFTLSTPGAEEYGKGFGGYKMFNNVLSSLITDLENETQVINRPIQGNRNEI